ncbi:hypothetical protein [Photorhabdus luminescens]|uniref:hypothetical protein n=1 Tax=Photorhabdus luminescens TaxID=29488 RepID=UPI0022407FBE|nr:hypothetical protein [Photorhabdus luminescens]MCW7762301.1 hypothetical protein [Photorhabdus luminescens subsp. venezuelensis]
MMNQREINIYLSKLISNPKYSIKMYENPNKFMDKYYIATESREVLIDFFKKNGGRFVNSSILQKIKRMDGLKAALTNVYRYLGEEKFELEFEKYLNSLPFNNDVKRNPVIESEFFCSFIIDSIGDDVLKLIALYEKEKNNLIIDLQNTDDNWIDYTPKIDIAPLEKVFVISHPTVRVKKFTKNINVLLDLLHKGKPPSVLKENLMERESNIMFYKKNKSREIISCMIGDVICHIILSCKNVILASNIFNEVNECYDIDKDTFISSLKMLNSNGLIFLSAKDILNE